MIADKHIWRTTDGRLVPDGHPDAAFLAYAAGDQIPDAEARKAGLLPVARKPEAKAASKPADKAQAKAEDKQATMAPPAEPGPYDPGEHKVGDVLAHLAEADEGEVARVLSAEAAGKNRASILALRPGDGA